VETMLEAADEKPPGDAAADTRPNSASDKPQGEESAADDPAAEIERQLKSGR
jgi:hypothetical protein